MPSRRSVLAALGATATALSGCSLDAGGPTTPDQLRFRLPAFGGGRIPRRFTCEAGDGSGVSPPVAVDAVPPPTEALALVLEYPVSVGETFTHWVVWNLPPDTDRIPADLPDDPTLAALGGARQGQNGTGQVGYVGPCPPPTADPQAYWVTLYALRRELDVRAGAPRDPVDEALETATLASKRLRPTFRRTVEGDPTRTPLDRLVRSVS